MSEDSKTEVKRRVRMRKVTTQIQELLNASQALDKEPTNELTIARMKFLQARLAVLTTMQAREHQTKFKKALAEVTRLTAENQKLTAENERLKQEVAAKSVARPSATEHAVAVLAKYEAEKKTVGEAA